MRFVTVLFASIISAVTVYFAKKHGNRLMMRFFRDLSRFKARKRLYGNNAALIPILMGKEEPININLDRGADDFTMTLEQLSEMDGRTETTPIYISVKGNIYDVSAAREMYGPGGAYSGFSGRDATRGFANGCMEERCMTSSLEGLTEVERKEIDRWVELYHNHDKYTYIGRLLTVDPMDAIVTEEIEEQHSDSVDDDHIEIDIDDHTVTGHQQ